MTKKYKNKEVNGAALGFGLATAVLAGSLTYTLLAYDNTTVKLKDEKQYRIEVEELNEQIIHKYDEIKYELDKKVKMEVLLEKKVDESNKKNENLLDSLENKDEKIEKLEKDLQAKKERERQAKLLAESKAIENKESSKKLSEKGSDDDPVRNTVSDSPKQVVKGNEGKTLTMKASAYTSTCDGCIGITKSGVNVKNTTHYQGKRVVAVDPSVIPLGSTLKVESDFFGTFYATAQDTGSAIKNKRLDILVSNKDRAINFGRRDVTVTIIN